MNSLYPVSSLKGVRATSCTLTTAKRRWQCDMKGYKVKNIILNYAFNNFISSSPLSMFVKIYVGPFTMYLHGIPSSFQRQFSSLSDHKNRTTKKAHTAFSIILFLWSEKWKKAFIWRKKLEIILAFLLKALPLEQGNRVLSLRALTDFLSMN